ncbi:NUDIX domain-containing protein [Actinoplanes sp. TRM 88003]|uniref:NUDIX domain-containing protein n=1 Tax=Paractinoplanes aksuensis TaxID=2939490 RepID=A0ABT1E444_9ACTN|nr:NUDIX domain-containing protein [Actinoplanes aksuensis]MCO8277807.1 NUDIX domain-containing protein [Actinoplanes aksuensis]
MATSNYIKKLREKIGHDLVWVPGAIAVIMNDNNEVLLGRRADDETWGLVGGFVEPNEQPADTAVREALEETGLTVAPQRIASVIAYERTYSNGDQCRYLDTAFLCKVVSGSIVGGNDESSGFEWFAKDRLPKLGHHDTQVIEAAFGGSAEAWFVPAA